MTCWYTVHMKYGTVEEMENGQVEDIFQSLNKCTNSGSSNTNNSATTALQYTESSKYKLKDYKHMCLFLHISISLCST